MTVEHQRWQIVAVHWDNLGREVDMHHPLLISPIIRQSSLRNAQGKYRLKYQLLRLIFADNGLID